MLHLKIVAELKSKNGIVNVFAFHCGNVLLRRHVFHVVFVAGNSPARHDGAKVEVLAQFLARFVQAATQTHVAVFGIGEYINAIQHVTLGVVRGGVNVAGDFHVGVLVAKLVIVDHHRKGSGNHLAIVFNANLPFRKCF